MAAWCQFHCFYAAESAGGAGVVCLVAADDGLSRSAAADGWTTDDQRGAHFFPVGYSIFHSNRTDYVLQLRTDYLLLTVRKKLLTFPRCKRNLPFIFRLLISQFQHPS